MKALLAITSLLLRRIVLFIRTVDPLASFALLGRTGTGGFETVEVLLENLLFFEKPFGILRNFIDFFRLLLKLIKLLTVRNHL